MLSIILSACLIADPEQAQPVLAGWLGSIRSGRSSAGSASRRRSTTH